MSLIGGMLLFVLVRDELLAVAQAAAVSTAVRDSAIFDVFLKTEFMAIPRVNRFPGVLGWVGG
jgi:hypothetical protein